jgi:hypothetical protein
MQRSSEYQYLLLAPHLVHAVDVVVVVAAAGVGGGDPVQHTPVAFNIHIPPGLILAQVEVAWTAGGSIS